MLYTIVMYFLACLVDLLTAKRMSGDEKDLEIALLRLQLRIVERRQERGPHIHRWQKILLAVLADRLKERSQQAKEKLEATILLFRPATVIGWQRALVRWKWIYRQMVWQLDGRKLPVSHFLHDNDKKFTDSFDTIFRSEGIEIVPLPHRAPNANAFAERWSGRCGKNVWISC